MPYKNPEAKKAWRRRNSKAIQAYTKEWEIRNPEKAAAIARRQSEKGKAERRAYRAAHPLVTKMPDYQKRYRAKIRRKASAVLGDKCERCGFDDPRALHFDHKTPLLRRSSGRDRRDPTAELRRCLNDGTLRDVYQLLCANCHSIKTRAGGEHALRAWFEDSPRAVPAEPAETLPLFAGPYLH